MQNLDKVKEAIKSIIRFLDTIDNSPFFEQMNYLQKLLDLVDNKQFVFFVEKINSAELWGGSGSIWESEYGMTTIQRRLFEDILFHLLLIMKEEGIMKKRARKVFKFLENRGNATYDQ